MAGFAKMGNKGSICETKVSPFERDPKVNPKARRQTDFYEFRKLHMK